jgi:hypothetical protein
MLSVKMYIIDKMSYCKRTQFPLANHAVAEQLIGDGFSRLLEKDA